MPAEVRANEKRHQSRDLGLTQIDMRHSEPKQVSRYFDYSPLQDGWIHLVAVENATDASDIGE